MPSPSHPRPPRALPEIGRRVAAIVSAALIGFVGCGGGGSGPVATETPRAPAEGAPTDVTAAEVLEKMAAVYRDAGSYFDNAEYHESFIKQGEDVLVEAPPHQVAVVLERPNRFRLVRRVPETSGPDRVIEVGCDGKTLTATVSYLPDQFLQRSAPESLDPTTVAPDPALRNALFFVPLENLYPQLDLLLATEESPARLLADASPRLLANRELAGVECHRVELDRPAGKYVLWIDSDSHLLRRMDAPTDEVREQLDPQGVMLDWRLWIDFKDATIGGAMADSVFQITPPEGARTVESFGSSE